MAAVQDAIDALSAAEVEAETRAKGKVTARNDKRRDLVSLLQQLPEHAPSIVASAGMYLKGRRGPGGHGFRARTRTSGVGEVDVPSAGQYAGYEFQYSLDLGVTWLPFPQPYTTKASATLPDMKPGSRVLIRYRSTVKGVTGDWSDPIAIIVD